MQSGREMEALEAALQENFDKAAATAAANDDGAGSSDEPDSAPQVIEESGPATSPVEVLIHDPAPEEITVDAAPGQHNQETNNESN